eukprot:c53882_g1_i1 orf=365-718(-)
MGPDFVVGVLGVLTLAHAGFSTIQYRAALKIREEEFTQVPPQVFVEIVISLLLCFWAALRVPGAFLPILPDSKENAVVHLPENLDFMIFNHRGKAFPLQVDGKFNRKDSKLSKPTSR